MSATIYIVLFSPLIILWHSCNLSHFAERLRNLLESGSQLGLRQALEPARSKHIANAFPTVPGRGSHHPEVESFWLSLQKHAEWNH